MSADGDSNKLIVSGPLLGLVSLASVSALGYAVLLWLSWQFGAEIPAEQRPTVWMLTGFAGLFVAYWLSIRLALHLPSSKLLAAGILAASALFRGILLPSVPMHEIDIYRYVWDGAVVAEGISPYRYSPEQVLAAVNAGGAPSDPTLQRLVELQAGSGSLNESLNTIHYGRYPSPYPIVSQSVFGLSALITPENVTTHTRMVIMKSLLVMMDLATLVVLMLMLRTLDMHVGWSIAYGWCPLMMKEIANGGHLDSIAIFIATLAIWLLVRSSKNARTTTLAGVLAGAVLALAIGAKLYPVVLVPLFAAVWLRQRGWKVAAVGLVTTCVVSIFLLYPLFGPTEKENASAVKPTGAAVEIEPGQLAEPTASPPTSVAADEGIKAFLQQWEMNDLLFMLVLENVRVQGDVPEAKRPWFVFTSDEWATSVVAHWARLRRSVDDPDGDLSPTDLRRESFSLARAVTGGGFALYACLLAWFAAGKNDPREWCRAAMLTLAWFWLTCPTQNPWYWCWIVPLLPFARRRTWLAVAAVTMLYYLRFWLIAHYPQPPVLGTPYDGAYFFYFVVAWLEFLPVLIALAMESALAWRNR
ncbi:MAG: hypothetical protein AAGD11_12345 [Planctomycetota bacterium]